MNNNYPQRFDNSILSQISRDLNKALGDTTGRSVSERTAQGMKETFDLDMTDENAMHVAHAAMVATPLLLRSKNRWAQFFGAVLGTGLFVSYQNGKQYSFPQKQNYLKF